MEADAVEEPGFLTQSTNTFTLDAVVCDEGCPAVQRPAMEAVMAAASLDKRCPQKHRLTYFATDRYGFSCEICHLILPKGTLMWGCRKCDWDICDAHCVSANQLASDATRSIYCSCSAIDDYVEPDSLFSAPPSRPQAHEYTPLVARNEADDEAPPNLNCPMKHGLKGFTTMR